jgi:feruloyl esterase
MLKLGNSQTAVPNSADVNLMLAGLKGYFLTPLNPEFDVMKVDFDRDPARVREAAEEMDATSTMLSTFSLKSKLLLYHGMADPFFSAWDTVRYFERVEQDNGGSARVGGWARLFLVPGMTHCAGGPAPDQFDRIGAIVAWVEEGRAPERIIATGRSFPGVSRPLCPWPGYARYTGKGPESEASSFVCTLPGDKIHRADSRSASGQVQ